MFQTTKQIYNTGHRYLSHFWNLYSEITSDFTISGWWYTYPSETYEGQLG